MKKQTNTKGFTEKAVGIAEREAYARKNQNIFVNEYGLTRWYWIARHNENLKLGENTQIGNFTMLGCEHGLTIEDDVKIGYNCTIFTHSTVDGKKGPIVLKKGCKIGASCTIMPGVTIGKGAVIGAMSLVNCDVPGGEVWAGIPAKRLYKSVKEIGTRKSDRLDLT